jgi:hypothetical protein
LYKLKLRANFISILKFVKKVVRRAIHNPVLVIDKYRYGERFSHKKIKISHQTVNPPTEYIQFVINHFPHGEILRYNAKKELRGIFSPKEAILLLILEL